MKYAMDTETLDIIFAVNERKGLRTAFRMFTALTTNHAPSDHELQTIDVEDFAIDFYTQYNATYGATF